MMSLHPKIIDLTLDRVWRLLHRVGDPQAALPPVIHIAGTNGKGSTLAMLRAGLEGGGARCHAYTSPHLVRFHERVRLAGELISEAALARVLDECLAANGPEPITYFEITTVAALLAFARTPADWTLLEVGLGGRLDATNVVARPALTVITPVSLDHQHYLGDTLAAIAAEKAGILKPGVACVVAEQTLEAGAVIEARAAEVGAPLMWQGRDWQVWRERDRLVFQDLSGLADLPLPTLRGPHQITNAGAALAALRHLDAGEAGLEAAMQSAEWAARMQRLTAHPFNALAPGAELWLDGGHNPAAGTALAAALDELPDRRTILLCGMLSSKDPAAFLQPLAGRVAGVIGVPVRDADAARAPDEIAATGRALGLDARCADDVTSAVSEAARQAPGGRIVICGSLYLAGEVLGSA